ncbi:F-box/LRR-repeat protein 6 [Pristis pectinata]|uniref:F-box/LRR-repeat protein 6 n=1 Tax=Pristis pectinata TaxID=685728 RepID=UPI00223D92A2|nr:F-box/LRR-repeat protein 6 [Pristis pectinata]XP_051871468.1 F-box/LRR-repeat protein 6 [Pristis pectinata]
MEGSSSPHTSRQTSRKREVSVESQGRSHIRVKKVRRATQWNTADYTVHDTDNDMLLIISNKNEVQRKARPRRPWARKSNRRLNHKHNAHTVKFSLVEMRTRGATSDCADGQRKLMNSEPKAQKEEVVDQWGQQLPIEVLVHIFHYVVSSNGAVPFLCRMARVCHLWNGAAGNPRLWRRVTISQCWVNPGKKLQPPVQRKIQNTLSWLTENRFSQLREFSLCHWNNLVSYTLKAITKSCPHLVSLRLTNCTGVTSDVFEALATHSRKLESLNLQHSVVDTAAVISFLETAGSNLKQLCVTYNSRLHNIFNAIVAGCCTELRLLEVNTEIKQTNPYFQFCIEMLQAGCPKLQVLRLLNLTWFPKACTMIVSPEVGFSELEELCLATSSFSLVTDEVLVKLLHLSSKLRTLDLRGCYRITSAALQLLPCQDLARLFLGLYCSTTTLLLAKQGSEQMALKWKHSLEELDLTGQCYKEKDLELAMGILAGTEGNHVLRSLNLAGTKVTLDAIRVVVSSSPRLSYLNLTSCRCLPRGLKRIYRGQEEIAQFVNRLLSSPGGQQSAGDHGPQGEAIK